MPPSIHRHPLRDWADLGMLVVIWGSSFALTKVAVAEIAPVWVMAWRIVIGTLFLIVALPIAGERLPDSFRDWLGCGFIAFAGNVAPFWLISWGTQHISSGLAGILMGAVPLVVMVMAAFLLADEPLTGRKTAGFLAGFAGVVLLIGPNALLTFDFDDLHLVGALAVLLATIGYATQAVAVRLMTPMPGLRRAAGVMITATAMAVPLALANSPDGYGASQTGSLLAVAALGLFPTALAALILFPLLASAGASFTALTNYLVPVFALLVGVVFLGETFAATDFLGLGLVLAGIGVARARRATGPAPSRS